MNLKELLKAIDVADYRGSDPSHITISAISSDSRRVKAGHVFVAVSGSLSDGHFYIKDALGRGASAIVISENMAVDGEIAVPLIRVDDSKKALKRLCAFFYHCPYQKIKSVGITGTNGKTTVSYLIKNILTCAGVKSGLIGTIAHRIKEDVVVDSLNTTPGIVELHQMAHDMVEAGDEYLVMEVSSHALDQDRLCGMVFHSAIFTNLTQDHLDYHKTMEAYSAAKEKLFTRYSDKETYHIINQDDPFGARLLKLALSRKVSYGFSSNADVRLVSFKICREFSRAIIRTSAGDMNVKTVLIGRHNLYNILAAAAWGISAGFDLAVIKKGVESLRSVSGRLDRIDCPKGFSVFVDYAHTEDALKNVLESLRATLHNGRIITVFGCGGNRDKTKRPKMGYVAAAFSDQVIVTSDNPRQEDPALIAREVVHGINEGRIDVELDRFEAIKKALISARAGDIVLIAGKGHETYQIIKDKVMPFNDKLAVEAILKEMKCYV